MDSLIQRVAQKIVEARYRINITKPVENINPAQNDKDTVVISDQAKKQLSREQKIEELKRLIAEKDYEIAEEMLDYAACSIAKMFVPTLE